MTKVIFKQKAIDDLSDIWEYTMYKWSENQADKYYNTIKSACKEIENNPQIGKVYSEISKDLYGFQSGKHIIFYFQISKDEIEIIRILHERMDLINRINEKGF